VNPDRDDTQDGAETTVIDEKVHSILGAAHASKIKAVVPIYPHVNGLFHESMLVEVDEVRTERLFVDLVCEFIPALMRNEPRVSLGAGFKNALLKFSIQFHMSGLQGLFLWKAKATTDAPDTYNA